MTAALRQGRGRRVAAAAAGALFLLLAMSVTGATTLPFADSFELYPEGTAIPSVGAGWDPSAPSGLVATASSDTYTVTPTFPAATHTNVAAFDDVARVDFTGTAGVTKSYVQFMVKPVLGDVPASITLGKTPEYAFIFDTDGHIRVFHTDLDPTDPSPTGYPTTWSALTHSPVNTNDWYHIQVCVDYRTGSYVGGSRTLYQKFFQVSLNGTPLSAPLGVIQPKFYPGVPIPPGDRNGTWFFCADFPELVATGFLPGKPDGFGVEGFGRIDDLLVGSSTNVPNFDLTIATTHGGVAGTPAIPSTTSYPYGSNVLCSVSDATIEYGSTTQLVCTGWTNGTGTVAPVGTATSVTVVINKASSLKWRWEYRYLLDTETDGNGTVDVDNGWFPADALVEIGATPGPEMSFAGWSGDVPTSNTNDNPLTLRMDRARSITAHFAGGTVPQYTSHGTPHSWLEGYGITNDFEAADTNDWEPDGSRTWEEYVAGTEPDDPNSVFEVTEIVKLGSSYLVEWYGTTNHGVTNAFNVMRASVLENGGNWSTVATDRGRAPDGVNTWSDNSPPAGKVFYRIEIPWP